MQYTGHYHSPLGDILLAADEVGLTGLWFEGQEYFGLPLDKNREEKELPVIARAKEWLDIYFAGREPEFRVPLHLIGTAFQKEVWEILCAIPYGQTVSYGEVAGLLAARRGLKTMSAQAVGGAVAHNPISIIVPCHRVLGANGSLVGYAGGTERKATMLYMEKKTPSGGR